MKRSKQIVDALLEADFDPKDYITRNDINIPTPIIRTSSSSIKWGDSGNPDDYTEENGWVDEDGKEFEVDVFDRAHGHDAADVAANWLKRAGVSEASSSHFHPGVWYSSEATIHHQTGEQTTYSYHLEGFTDEQEEKIFNSLFPRRRP